MSGGCGCDSPGMMAYEQALDQLLDAATSAEESGQPVIQVTLAQALGRILAEDQHSAVDVPPNDNSAMDGYALHIDSLGSDAVSQLVISQRVPAGADPEPLKPGTAARIFTGAKIPEGANVVVKQEDCETTTSEGNPLTINGESAVQLPSIQEKGQNIRLLGQDIRQGEVIMPAGTRLQPQHLGVLASVGIGELSVYRPLKVAILSTGDELIEPGLTLAPGQIYNSNRYTLTGMINGLGMEMVDLGIVADTPEATDEALSRAAKEADVVISSGGVSVGEEDHVKASVEKLGSLNLWRIAIKPGKPFAYGEVQGKPFLGLPGNPAAVLVSFNILARPFLLKMQGATELMPISYRAPVMLTRKAQGRKEFMRARLTSKDGKPCIEPFSNQSSGVLSSAVWANGYAIIPANTAVTEGDEVDFVPFSEVMN
ncbi:gephyrin-like molybdotransferase Glp [Motiliproteus sp. MSK22-1]|uniref:molybdopterin molybdotransferase MoeA n=1 Tax=Motiliproteus sp. MSK22-1 TaxID=1897630 RepID=UPI0009774B6D|nr:gephyrin-like molybdotransferase Glp [Motiliproteus sp. MSK22-1]OMH32054.1 molybdopterin molybdenumtransferase MoeA [Motiliproteus sp. MSK22-1]